MSDINPRQITFARVRRRMTKAQLAQTLGVSSRTTRNYEDGSTVPDAQTVARLAAVLRFPVGFFQLEDEMPKIGEHAASFRALSRMSEPTKQRALCAGALALRFNDWMEERFTLPQADLPDLSDLPPEEAAVTLRSQWGLGNAPVPNMIHLLESKGIRVFSLAEDTLDVDAFCTWHNDRTPVIFLNTLKTAERSRFDAAHELGHLVLDLHSMRHGDEAASEKEARANEFASAFLMPKASVVARRPEAFTTAHLIAYKKYWKVSLVALARRYHTLGLISEWAYRNLCIHIQNNGYRRSEPEPIERETSQLLSKVFDFLKAQGIGRRDIARQLQISVDEINALSFQLTPLSVLSGQATEYTPKRKPALRLVKDGEPESLGQQAAPISGSVMNTQRRQSAAD